MDLRTPSESSYKYGAPFFGYNNYSGIFMVMAEMGLEPTTVRLPTSCQNNHRNRIMLAYFQGSTPYYGTTIDVHRVLK